MFKVGDEVYIRQDLVVGKRYYVSSVSSMNYLHFDSFSKPYKDKILRVIEVVSVIGGQYYRLTSGHAYVDECLILAISNEVL